MSNHDKNGHKHAEQDEQVHDLIIDHRVQRDSLDMAKVNNIVNNFNIDGLGRVTVSVRDNGDRVVIDGWHRVEAVRRLTDNAGTIPARVYEELTLKEEAALFLTLNTTNRPRVLDKWKVRVTMEDPVSVEITGLLTAFGWSISHAAQNGHVNAVAALERIYTLSKKVEAEPHLIHVAFLVITKAWGHDRYGAQSTVIEGIAALAAEHKSLLDLPVLIGKLKEYKGGPQSLIQEARNLAGIRNMRVPMAVADILTEKYNVGRKKNVLPGWRKRS